MVVRTKSTMANLLLNKFVSLAVKAASAIHKTKEATPNLTVKPSALSINTPLVLRVINTNPWYMKNTSPVNPAKREYTDIRSKKPPT